MIILIIIIIFNLVNNYSNVFLDERKLKTNVYK
jgi:hypothetical protein